jgi:hypothetical protein
MTDVSWKNISDRTLVTPAGKTVKPGETLSEKQAVGLNTRALERGGIIKPKPKPKPKPKE